MIVADVCVDAFISYRSGDKRLEEYGIMISTIISIANLRKGGTICDASAQWLVLNT